MQQKTEGHAMTGSRNTGEGSPASIAGQLAVASVLDKMISCFMEIIILPF
jgi:hypothetical protein